MATFDPAPLTQAVADLVKTGTDLAKSVIDHPGDLPAGVAAAVENLLGEIERHTNNVLEKVKAIATATQAAPPLPPAVDVIALLNQIAQGITGAEAALNKFGMVVATGSVEAEVNVLLPGGTGGAMAKINFQITPKPTN
jgi:hypothetical protein